MWLLVIREVEKTPLGSMEASVRIVIDIRGALLVHHSNIPVITRKSEIVKLVVTLELKIKFHRSGKDSSLGCAYNL